MRDSADDLAAYRQYGEALVDAVRAELPGRCAALVRRLTGDAPDPGTEQAIDRVVADAVTRLEVLVSADPAEPLSGPLERLRSATHPLTARFDELGVTPPTRDAMDIELRPDDRYGLGPMTFADLGPRTHEAGIAWGAAKAHLHLRRRAETDGGQA